MASCTSLRYLRVDAQGAKDSNLEGDSGALDPIPRLKALTDLPDVWFIQVPHDLFSETFSGDWAADYVENDRRHMFSEETDEYTRLLKADSEFYDAKHIEALKRNFTTLLPRFNTDAHPSTDD